MNIDIVDKLKKLYKLSTDNPNEEEKASATEMLNKLLLKNNLTLSDLQEDVLNKYIIKLGKGEYKDLSMQVISSFGLTCYTVMRDEVASKNEVWVETTKLIYTEIKLKLRFYKQEFKKQVNRMLIAFCIKNALVNPNTESTNMDITPEDEKILDLVDAIEKEEYLKQIKQA